MFASKDFMFYIFCELCYRDMALREPDPSTRVEVERLVST